MTHQKFFGALAAIAWLAGCATYVGKDVEQLRHTTPSGSAFTQELTEEYREIALFEADEMHDWVDAEHFAGKGMNTAGGEVVLPEHVRDWRLAPEQAEELGAARLHLVGLLDRGAREQMPQEAARAQGRFDCWIEQQEESHQPDHIAACRDQFHAALAKIEAVMGAEPLLVPAAAPLSTPGAQSFVVLFGLGSTRLDAGALSTVEEALRARAPMPSFRNGGPWSWPVRSKAAGPRPAASASRGAAKPGSRCRPLTGCASRPTGGSRSPCSKPPRTARNGPKRPGAPWGGLERLGAAWTRPRRGVECARRVPGEREH
jgi:OOP family OmpA-OmpF porin